jgi:adenylosuccinate synthase
MSKFKVVIGAGYGDEGKGLVTDYLASQATNPLVVRFNGGAQAGHTVVTPEGKRHVFSHFGSGTFAGAKTFLSKHFLVNPIMFEQERKKLKLLDVDATAMIDPDCMVTTPFDMLINQAEEKARGVTRHGSCGLGINETVERHNCGVFDDDFSLRYKHLRGSYEEIGWKLKLIRDEYVPMRLGLDHAHVDKDVLNSPMLIENFLNDIAEMKKHTRAMVYDDFNQWNGDVIFEGAQGLKLDQNYKHFPYVTRSNTGIVNVTELVPNDDLDIYYVTRAYTTRHGAGPLKDEEEAPAFLGRVECPTNKPNEFQGKLRFASLDAFEMVEDIKNDLEDVKHGATTNLVVTCMDHMPSGWGTSPYRYIAMAIDARSTLFSYGSTRKNIGRGRSLIEERESL